MDISEDAADYFAQVRPHIESAILALKLKYDSRAVVAVMANEAATIYQSLREAGIPGYDEFTLKRIFKYLEGIAQSKPEKPPLVIEDGAVTLPDTTH